MSTARPGTFRRLLTVVGLLSTVIAGRATTAEGQPATLRTPDDMMAEVGALAPEFGGVYIDAESRTHLFLTDPSAAAAQRAMTALAQVFGDASHGGFDVGGAVTIHRGQHAFAQLKRWHDAMTPVLAVSKVVLTDIDERANRLLVGVADRTAETAVRNELVRVGIPPAAVQVAVVPEVRAESLQDNHTPKVGGLQITSGSGVICTLGFNARRAGVAGFVTASHCTDTAGSVEGTIFWQPTPPTSCPMICLPVAQETVDPPFLDSNSNWLCPNGKVCRYSDAAFAKYVFDSPILFTAGRIANPVQQDSTDWDGDSMFTIPYVLKLHKISPLIKVGRTTGKTFSTLMVTCANVNVKNTNKTMLCQYKGPTPSAPGDSGAPVFYFGPSTPLGGLLWGSGGWFSAISLIQNELGALSVCATGYAC
ncbi:MAG TPA: hypothetical protein VNO51_10115 [Ilumatobacteraceae bacterium]|nr:hypothetical protein [Ilumatobacteraceae bacterium]